MSSSLLFAFGIMSEMVPVIVVGAFIQFAYAEIWGLNAAYVSIIWTLFNIFKFFVIPNAGKLVDQSTNKIKLYLFTAAISLTGFWIVWNPILFENKNITLVEMLVGLMIFAIGSSSQLIVRSSLFQELFDAKSRSTVAGLQQLFSIVGVIAGMIVPPILSDGWKNIQFMATVMILLSACGVACCCTGSIMRSKHQVKQEKPKEAQEIKESFLRRTLAPIQQIPNLRLLVLATIASNIGFQSILSNTQLYIKYFVPGVKETRVFFGFELASGSQIGLAQLIGQLFSLGTTPIWLNASSKLGYGNTWVISAAGFGIITLIQYFFQTGTLGFLFFCQIVGSSFMPALFVVPGLALAEIVDDVQVKTGQNVAGQYQGIISMSVISSSVLQGLLSTAVFGSSDYNPALDVQSESALSAINYISVLIPAITLILSGVAMSGYKQKGKKE